MKSKTKSSSKRASVSKSASTSKQGSSSKKTPTPNQASASNRPPTPELQNVYIRIDAANKHTPLLFFDAAGLRLMDNTTPLDVLYDPSNGKHGKVQYNFIRNPVAAPHTNFIETASLVIIAQTVDDANNPLKKQQDSPFSPPTPPVYFLPDPAGPNDPGNLKGTAPVKNGAVEGIETLKVRQNGKVGPKYKYSIIALCDGSMVVALVDPTVIINNS